MSEKYPLYPNGYRFHEFYIRPQMLESIRAYVEEGRPVGDFLRAVICNDLRETVMMADYENLRNLPAFVAFFMNEVPGVCWGSKENMEVWLNVKKGGKGE